jgi:hypothetical protein
MLRKQEQNRARRHGLEICGANVIDARVQSEGGRPGFMAGGQIEGLFSANAQNPKARDERVVHNLLFPAVYSVGRPH